VISNSATAGEAAASHSSLVHAVEFGDKHNSSLGDKHNSSLTKRDLNICTEKLQCQSNRSGLTEYNFWVTASTSNIEILELFHWKALRMIVDATSYVRNMVIRRDLQIPTVKEEIRR
jgi:hypothetical protein